jgi:hypothetical protein
MPELMATLNAVHMSEKRKNTFLAALQGINLDETVDEENVSKPLSTVEEVQARAIARLTGDANLASSVAQGFTPEMGISYMLGEGTEIG